MVFVFFFAAILSASVFSFAAIVGTEDFDGNKSGWSWDGGTAQGWTNSSGQAVTITTEVFGTRIDENGDEKDNYRAVITSSTYLYYGASSQLNSGTFAYTFDMQIEATSGQYGGFSLFNGTSETSFVGKLGNRTDLAIIRYGTPKVQVQTNDDYWHTNKTYAAVTNPSGMFVWAFDLGHELQYEDLFTTPALQVSNTLTGNNRLRLGVGAGTMYFDNIKTAYSDSNTVINKGDATTVTSLTDIFGAVPIVPCIQEAFSNYEEGALVGQFQQNLGQAPLTKWTGANATVDNSQNLDYPGFSGEQGVLNVSGGDNGAKMTLDSNVMDDWGVMGTDGLIGGDSVTNKILYYGYLLQSADGGSGMGAELYRGANKVLSTSDFGIDDLDTDTHLFVVKLMFGENGDNALLFLDPDMSLSEEEQDPDSVYSLSGENFSFDSIVIRGDSAFTYDELRAAQTWWALSDYNAPAGVPEPSTWALLALGVVVLFLRKRVRN